MTIRDYLRRRALIFFGIGFAGWLICVGAMVLQTSTCSPHCKGAPPPALFFVGMPLFALAGLGISLFIKCPRCSRRLPQIAGTLMAFRRSRQANYCPFCGVNFEEPCQRP